jgi:hypothetical protein
MMRMLRISLRRPSRDETRTTEGPVRHAGASTLLIFPAILTLGLSIGCGSNLPSASSPARIQLELSAAGLDDPRTYSVGRIQLRALDAQNTPLAAEIFPIDRQSGRFELDFSIPAGEGLTLLVEPLGSGILPDGNRTESGVALQGIARPITVVANEILEISTALEPFIPDSLQFVLVSGSVDLRWKAMRIAASHRVKVIEIESGARVSRLVSVVGNRVWVEDLQSHRVLEGFQVQSVNRFADSAFSDTLFWRF